MAIFECSTCGKKLRSREGIIRHLRKCGSPRKITDPLRKRYPCDYCHNEYFSWKGLSKHLKKNHSVGTSIRKEVMKSLKCRYCSAMFASRQGRIKHSKKNHPEYNIRMDELNSRKTHDCVFCGKTFVTKRYRNRHENICMNKSEGVASSSGNSDQRTEDILTSEEIIVLQGDTSAPEDAMLFQFEETPQFGSNDEESHGWTSGGEINVTPRLLRYIRERKKFSKLGTPDVNSPRRARINLEYGQKTVINYQKQINALQHQVRRLQKKVETFQELLLHLVEQNQISATTAEAFLVVKNTLNASSTATIPNPNSASCGENGRFFCCARMLLSIPIYSCQTPNDSDGSYFSIFTH